MNKKTTICIAIAIILLATFVSLHFLVDRPVKNIVAGSPLHAYDNNYTAVAAGATSLVHAGPTVLEGVVFGSDTSGGASDIWDSATSPSPQNPVFAFSSTTLHGYYPMDIQLQNGLAVTVTSELGTVFIWH